MKLRQEVQSFAEAMESQLVENDWKGDWKHLHPLHIVLRIQEELGELAACLLDSDTAKDLRTLDEAADVANYLMILCDQIGVLPKNRRGA